MSDRDMRSPPDYSQQQFMADVRVHAENEAALAARNGLEDVTPDRILIELTANLLTFVFISNDPGLIEAVVEKAQAQAMQVIERQRAQQAEIEAGMDLAAKLGGGWGIA